MLNTRFNLKFICIAFALVCVAMTTSLQAAPGQTAENFVQSMELYNEVVSTQSNDGSKEQILELSRLALNHARETSKIDLNEHLEGLGDQYYLLFIEGLELQIAGQTENNKQQIGSGQQALDNWYSWYASNLENIRRVN